MLLGVVDLVHSFVKVLRQIEDVEMFRSVDYEELAKAGAEPAFIHCRL
jgi:hypothetical protein